MLPTLNTPRLTVEHVAPGHAGALAAFFRRNERHLAPWDPPRPAGILESEFWQAECERAVEDFESGAVVRVGRDLAPDGAHIIEVPPSLVVRSAAARPSVQFDGMCMCTSTKRRCPARRVTMWSKRIAWCSNSASVRLPDPSSVNCDSTPKGL